MDSVVLTLTNSGDTTADYLCGFAHEQGIKVIRFNTDRPISDLAIEFMAGRIVITICDNQIVPDNVSTVWMRRPTPLTSSASGDAAASQFLLNEWAEALEGFLAFIPPDRWINHPTCNAIASSKLEQISRASSYGLHVPETLLTQDPSKAFDWWKKWSGAVIVKPLSSGYLERMEGNDGLIYTNRVERGDIQNFSRVQECPTLFQRAIEKILDVRVTVIDEVIHAVGLKCRDEAGKQIQDIRRDNMEGVQYVPVLMPPDVQKKLLALIRSYSLRFSAIDFVIDRDGKWVFLEINPNGQWAWLDLVGATRIRDSFINAFRADREKREHGEKISSTTIPA